MNLNKQFYVIGDMCLDHNIYTVPVKLSAEAPIVVAKPLGEEYMLGMAGNVAKQLTLFGIKPILLSNKGDDFGEIFYQLEENIYLVNCQHKTNTRTIVKTRFWLKNQQALRLDQDFIHEPLELDSITCAFNSKIESIVIMSDYNKGLLENPEEIVKYFVSRNIPVYVDAKKKFERYSGATLLKPNLAEFESEYGKMDTMEKLYTKMEDISRNLDIVYVVVTLGKGGMICVDKEGNRYHSLAIPDGPFVDPCGAGDGVISSLAYLLESGFRIQEAMDLSNLLASIIVSKLGTYIIKREDILALPDSLQKTELLGVIP